MMMVMYIRWDMKREPSLYMGDSKKFYPPINKQTSLQKDWEVGFQWNKTGTQ
jgi:hypothetical protein